MKVKKLSVIALTLATLVVTVGNVDIWAMPSDMEGFNDMSIHEGKCGNSCTEVCLESTAGGVTVYQQSEIKYEGDCAKGTELPYQMYIENGGTEFDKLAFNQKVSVKIEDSQVILTNEFDSNATIEANVKFDEHIVTGAQLDKISDEILQCDGLIDIVKPPTRAGMHTGIINTIINITTVE